MEYASIIIKGERIFDGTGTLPFAGEIAIKDHHILAVAKEGTTLKEYIGPETKIIDAKERLVMPGLNDAHTHLTNGSFLEDPDFCFNLLSASSKEEAISMAKKFADTHPQNPYIFGYMMNNLLWEDQTLPSKEDIDKTISDRPVILQMADLHTIIVNSYAIEHSAITKDTPSPADGLIEKDANGELTGRFYDGACFTFTGPVFDPEETVYYDIYEKFFKRMNSLGITTASLVSPYGISKDPMPIFREMEKQGKLTTRIIAYPNIAEYEKERFVKLQEEYKDGKLRVKGLKQLVDGVTGVFTAYLLEPYTNNPSTCGTTSVDMNEFREQALNAIKDGVALRIHTIGDRAVREVLDIFEEGQTLYGKQNLRHVQEHLETVHPNDIKRFSKLGICCCMQPMHMLFDLESGEKENGLYGDKEAAVGKERAKYSWPIRSLLDSGAMLALGSDFPVVGIEPFAEIYGAITRQTFDARPEDGWIKEQRITLAEALKAYTYGSAYIEACEDDLGTLEIGKLADIVILDRDLFAIEPKEILETKVYMTIMDGEIVYTA